MPEPRSLFFAAVAFTLAVAPRLANAQERLRFELFSDDRWYRTTLQVERDQVRTVRGAVFAGLGATAMLGPGVKGYRPMAAFAGADLGLWSSPTRFLQFSSSGLAPLPTSPAGSQGAMRARDLEGQAQIRASIGVGQMVQGESGADLEVEAKILHAGPYSTAWLRRDIAPVPFWEGWAKATFWPRMAMDRDAALVLPISYSLHRLGYGDDTIVDAPSGRVDTHRVAGGFGIRPYGGEFVHGWIEFLGVAWEKARAEPARGREARIRDAQRIDLDAVRIDGLVGTADRHVDLDLSTSFGGSWIWDENGPDRTSTFTFTVASAIHVHIDRDKDRGRVGGGIAVSRRAGLLADGSALSRGWRLEGRADVELFERRTGGSARWISDQLTLPNAPEEQRDRGFQHAFATEWYLAIVPGLQVGVNHLSTERCLAPWAPSNGAFCHQIGTFVRLAETWVR